MKKINPQPDFSYAQFQIIFAKILKLTKIVNSRGYFVYYQLIKWDIIRFHGLVGDSIWPYSLGGKLQLTLLYYYEGTS